MLAPLWTLLAATAVTLPARAQDSPSASTSAEAPSPPDADASDLPTESPEAELARLLTVHHSHPAECAAALKLFLQTQEDRPAADPHIVQNARLHLSGCLIRAGRPGEASQVMTAALRADATMDPPSHFVFGTEVLELYFRTKEKLRDEARDGTTRPDASMPTRERVIMERNRRWLASVPFGVGQFQNEDMALGYTLLGAETALAATAIASMAVQLNNYERAATTADGDFSRINQTNETARTLLTVSAWGFGVVTLAGIIEANLSFVPERRRVVTEERPKRANRARSLAFDVGLTPSGVSIHGQF